MADHVLIQSGAIAIRLMQDDVQDYQLVAKWLTNPAVLECCGGRDSPYPLAKVLAKYKPRVLAKECVVPCFVLYRALAIGYLQYYSLTDADKQEYGDYGVGESATIYGVDLFIGETSYWNQGIGTQTLSTALTYLFEHLQADKIVIDPRVSNTRAIRCYEKCGFSKVKQLPEHELHEGIYEDSWLMVADRSRQIS